MTQIQRMDKKQIERKNEAERQSVSVRVKSKQDVGGAAQLHASAEATADEFSPKAFKCVHEACGLVHNHDTTKHRSSDSFDMGEEESADMEFSPNCHCGLNEIAHSGDVADAPSPERANSMAPVPDSVTRSLQ